jgi:hypothetical protein
MINTKQDQLNIKIDKLLKKAKPISSFKTYLKNLLLTEYDEKFLKDKSFNSDKVKRLEQKNLGFLKSLKQVFNLNLAVVSVLTVLFLLGAFLINKKEEGLNKSKPAEKIAVKKTADEILDISSQLESIDNDMEEINSLLEESEEIDFVL